MAEETAKKKTTTTKTTTAKKTATNKTTAKKPTANKTTTKKTTTTKTVTPVEAKKSVKKEIKLDEIKEEATAKIEEVEEKVTDKFEEVKQETKDFGESAKQTIEKVMDTSDTTSEFEASDINNNKGMAVLSYIGILALIPYLAEKNSKYVRYHAIQGMNLFVVAVIYSILAGAIESLIKVTKTCELWGYTYECGKITPWWVIVPVNIIAIGIGALSIIGIVYVIQGKAKELPIINKFKFFK